MSPTRRAIAAGSLTLLTGCASPQQAPQPRGPDTARPPIALTGAFAENQAGLEIQWWTITDRGDGALARALAPYETDPVPMPERVRDNWRRNGLRFVAIPVDEVAAALGSLPLEDKVNRIWLGQTPGWSVAAPGAPWTGDRVLLIDGETIVLHAGQLRLLVRAWVSPTEGAPTLRTDVALQYRDRSASANTEAPFERPTTIRRPETEGMIFRTLTASMELTGAMVYCIVSEDPDVDWGAAAMPDGADAGEPTGVPTLPVLAPDPFAEAEREPDEADDLGPAPPGIPLLADALLSRLELLPTRRLARSIVILAPSVPAEFRLAPASAVSTTR